MPGARSADELKAWLTNLSPKSTSGRCQACAHMPDVRRPGRDSPGRRFRFRQFGRPDAAQDLSIRMGMPLVGHWHGVSGWHWQALKLPPSPARDADLAAEPSVLGTDRHVHGRPPSFES